ncbi:MAG: murein biosynthesis integral membrane protein MurJ [Micavibrio aeruginosavorus]|nr:murein biosynthesis integral membrane protein MurJ [Micavibrio aeruginosavorus]
MKLLKAMVTVAGMTGLSRVIGFVRDVMTAAILGAGPLADAFFVALKLPNFFRHVTAEGAFGVSFVPIYSETLQRDGENAAAAFAGEAFGVMFAIIGIFSIVMIAAMPWVIYLIAPGFEAGSQQYQAAVEMTRITFPYLLLMSLCALVGGMLNAHDKFAPFAAAPIFFNLCQIIALLCAVWFKTPGHALSWGIALAGVVQLAWLWWFLRRYKIHLPMVRPRLTADVKKLFKLMGPGAIGAGIIQINLFIDIVIASFLATGAISALYYADRLFQLPLGVVGIAVGTALLPMLTRALAAGQTHEARNLFNRALEYCLILTVPAAVALMVVPGKLIGVLFERGAFEHADTLRSAPALACLSLGLPAFIAVKILSTAYWSRQDTMTPVKIAVMMAGFNVVVAVIMTQFIDVAGLALATGLSGWAQALLLWRGLSGQTEMTLDERLKKNTLRIVLSAALMGAYLLAVAHFLNPWFAGTTIEKLLALGVLCGGGGFIYFAAAQILGVVRLQDLQKYLVKKQKMAPASVLPDNLQDMEAEGQE